MSYDKQALEDLRDKVKAGEYPSVDIQGDLNWTSFKWEMVTDAFEGSLDAAKALHEVILPDLSVDLGDNPCGDWSVRLYRDGGLGAEAKSSCPACAWLLAILEALIEEEEK